MRVHIRRSKTDQEGAGDTIAIVAGSVACPAKGGAATTKVTADQDRPANMSATRVALPGLRSAEALAFERRARRSATFLVREDQFPITIQGCNDSRPRWLGSWASECKRPRPAGRRPCSRPRAP